jgi:hypothetical protein
MVTTTATPPSVLETASGDLVLRVCGSTRHGQIVRLRSAKCTIGSGPRCTLRLRARGVRPIHCLIVRGSHGTVIRRWSPDTRLNGGAFTDAELVAGDRLSIGTIELEVLDAGRLSSCDPAASQQVPVQQPPNPSTPEPDCPDRLRIDQLTARLTLANRQGRQRVRRLLQRLRSADRELQRLRQLEAERPELERQLSEQTEALRARSNDLDRQREELERERREWNAKRAETEEQLRGRSQRLQAAQTESEVRPQDLSGGRQDEDEQAAVASQPEEPAAEAEQSQQPVAPHAPSEGPIDIADVFRRMTSRELSSKDQQQRGSSPEPAVPPPDGPAAESPSSPFRPAEEEDSIETYMARLLGRVYAVREGPEPLGSRPQAPPPGQAEHPAPRGAAEGSPPQEPAGPQSNRRPRHPEEMAPRAVAPERRVNLSAMRELANLSAHSAIDRHTLRQVRVATWGKLLTTIAGLGVGAELLWIWWATGTGAVTFYAAMVSFVVALLWGFQCTKLTGRKILGKSGRVGQESGEYGQGGDAIGPAQDPQEQAPPYGDRANPLPIDSLPELEPERKTSIDC